MMEDLLNVQTLLLVVAWLGYFALHSLLASLPVKYWCARNRPGLLAGYRLLFNAIALLTLLPLLYLVYGLEWPLLWAWQGGNWYLANGLALLAAMGFVWSLNYYDGQEFIGLRQWRAGVCVVEDQEHLHISPMHRFVRHPWYALGLVLVWTRDMDLAMLISAILISLYFLIGSRLEERKLLHYHGEAYRRYRAQVPGLLPRPWRYLSRQQAEDLLKDL